MMEGLKAIYINGKVYQLFETEKELTLQATSVVQDLELQTFLDFLKRITVVIDSRDGKVLFRRMLDSHYSTGLLLYGLQGRWYSASVAISDSNDKNYVGCKGEVYFGMHYSPKNSDAEANQWSTEDPVMVVDSFYAGAFPKQILWDGNQLIHDYHPGVREFAWIHYNIKLNVIQNRTCTLTYPKYVSLK